MARGENVPYSPVASVTPEIGSGDDYLHVQASPDAFGAQVGEGMQKLGQATQKVGDETTEYASKLQDIYNDSTARDAVTNGSKQLSDLEFQFKSKRGNDAVNEYPVFQQKAAELQEQISSSLPNAMAKKMFKDQFSHEVNGAIFRVGGWTANQAEQAQLSSINSSIASKVNMLAMTGIDPVSREKNIQGIRDDALQLAHFQGLPEDKADQMVSHNVGEGISSLIHSTIQSSPDRAKALYDEAMSAKFTANRLDENGNKISVDVPYLDAAHRSSISSMMGAEFRRQESEALQTARMDASAGMPFDKNSLQSAMNNTGRSQEYIDAEIHRLGSVQQEFGATNRRYDLENSLNNDKARALAGLPLQGSYDADTISAAFPKNPEKARDVLRQADDLHTVSGFVGGFSTKTPDQIAKELQSYKPDPSLYPSAPAIDWIMRHEGGFVSNDSGRGPTNFGVNQEANPDVDVRSMTKDQAAGILKSRYFDAIGADKMSPQMAIAAFDSAVNMGVSKTRTLLAQANNDPQKFIDLRRAEYSRLATENPDKYGASLDGWNKRLDDLQRDLPSLQTLGERSPGYGDQQRLYDTMQKAAQGYFKDLMNDPSGKVASTDPHLTELLNDATKDMSRLPAFVSASLARQEAVGVSPEDRSALPVSVAQHITSSITGNTASSADVLNRIKQQTGDSYQAIFRSLVTRGGLSSGYAAVAMLGADVETSRDATTLSRFMGEDTKGKTYADLFGQKEVTDIKNNVRSDPNVQLLRNSMLSSGMKMDQIDGMLTSIDNLALAKYFYEKDTNATNNAINSFMSKYQFMPNGGARVPSKVFDDVSRGAQEMLNGLSENTAVANTGHNQFVKSDDYFNAVKANPTWITSPSGTALRLMAPDGRLVVGKDGSYLEVPFSGYNAASHASSPSMPMNIPLGVGGGL